MLIYLTLDIYMSFVEASMASFTVEDCQKRVQNRFLLVQMVIKRVRQFRDGYEPLIKTDNKEIVTALREIAEGKVLPADPSLDRPETAGASADSSVEGK